MVGARIGRVAGIVAVVVIAFTAVAAILLRVLPGARTETDYLVIGAAGTFAAMALVFVLLTRSVKGPGFFSRRPKR